MKINNHFIIQSQSLRAYLYIHPFISHNTVAAVPYMQQLQPSLSACPKIGILPVTTCWQRMCLYIDGLITFNELSAKGIKDTRYNDEEAAINKC